MNKKFLLSALIIGFAGMLLLDFSISALFCIVYYNQLEPLIKYVWLDSQKHSPQGIPYFHYSFHLFALHFIRKKIVWFTLILIANTLMMQQTAIFSIYFGKTLDNLTQYIGQDIFPWSLIIGYVAKYYALGLFITGIYALAKTVSAWLWPWFIAEIEIYFLTYILDHSYFYFTQNLPGDILTKINYTSFGIMRILQFLLEETSPAICFVFSTVFIFIKDYANFRITLIAWIAVHSTISLFRLKGYLNLSLDNASKSTHLMGILGDILKNIFVVKTFYSQRFEAKYFQRFQSLTIESYKEAMLYDRTTSVLLDVFGYSLFYSLIFIYQIFVDYVSRIITLGDALAIYNTVRSLATNVWDKFERLADLMSDFSKCKDALNQILCVPHGVPDNYKHVDLVSTGKNCGKISLRNVYFCYSTDRMLLDENNRPILSQSDYQTYLFEDFNLEIEPNSKVGLVGLSGSGKSTLVNLIIRLFDPIMGAVYINEQNIAQVSKKSLSNNISYIPQGQFLFQRSILENIGYGCLETRKYLLSSDSNARVCLKELPERIQTRIVNAAKEAQCHDFIMNLPNGYETIYGIEAGLSGGQAQRIMIARAFINSLAKIIILDEATSALDPETEQYIRDSTRRISQDRTTLVVAHKLKTVKDFDRLIVFAKGKIIEDGTHEELLKVRGQYYKMWATEEILAPE